METENSQNLTQEREDQPDRLKEQAQQEQQGRLKQTEQELVRRRERKKERDLQDLNAKLKELKETRANRVKQRKKADEKLKSLEIQKASLEANQSNLRQQQGTKDRELEDQDRQKREQEQEAQRKRELVRQRQRDRLVKKLRSELREEQYIIRSKLRDLETFEMNEDSKQARYLDILNTVEALDSSRSEILRLQQKSTEVHDQRLAFDKELQSEEILCQPSNRDSVPSGKDHFSGNDLTSKIYKPLEDNQIRLLILWPATTDCYPLICSLRTVSLDDKPKYAALSYFWGIDSPAARLYLLQREPPDGYLDQNSWGYSAKHAIPLKTRNNLFRALLRLRKQNAPVALWVDIMCINQDDKSEKTDQLRKMVNIYRKAEMFASGWERPIVKKGATKQWISFPT